MLAVMRTDLGAMSEPMWQTSTLMFLSSCVSTLLW